MKKAIHDKKRTFSKYKTKGTLSSFEGYKEYNKLQKRKSGWQKSKMNSRLLKRVSQISKKSLTVLIAKIQFWSIQGP